MRKPILNGYALAGINLYDSVPVGNIMEIMSSDIPTGWLLCNHQELKASDYPDLYSKLKDVPQCKSENEGYFYLPDYAETAAPFHIIKAIYNTVTYADDETHYGTVNFENTTKYKGSEIATLKDSQPIHIIGKDIITYVESLPRVGNIHEYRFRGYQCTNTPYSGTNNDFIYTVYNIETQGWVTIKAKDVQSNREFIISQINGTWTAWRENATTTNSVKNLNDYNTLGLQWAWSGETGGRLNCKVDTTDVEIILKEHLEYKKLSVEKDIRYYCNQAANTRLVIHFTNWIGDSNVPSYYGIGQILPCDDTNNCSIWYQPCNGTNFYVGWWYRPTNTITWRCI